MPYYPETSVVMGLARVQRERKLPPGVVVREMPVNQRMEVEAFQPVLQGDVLGPLHKVDAAALVKKVTDPEQIASYIEVREGQHVEEGQILARKGRGRRVKTVISPVNGQIARIEGTEIVIQAIERSVEVFAGIPGQVEHAENNTVLISATGALIQCVWGNGPLCFETFRFLPEGGFTGLSQIDVRISEYRRVVVISPDPITKRDLAIAEQQEVAGVVAPSMPSNLRELALRLTFPVILTEGFGQRRPTEAIYQLLGSSVGRQAAFNAAVPDRWTGARPEIFIPLPSGNAMPPTPSVDRALAVGDRVRIVRAPWDGLVVDVVELPSMPQVTESGLRLPSARVKLPSGRIIAVALVNLELLG
ncbi:MAG TPA: hypothetical protein PKD09_10325 [Aggregatilinea sp.]|jgi:hypothetical protein|uniref:hypothetical protein n=1 Tax=Aggregatilinea sp. TaxID=2806333 RepID=UPI002C4DC45A|nr:hypothetical protein [Aggregatilinea sp.]HML22037.1 hypothetical protein [Aggregatilinea sp.]